MDKKQPDFGQKTTDFGQKATENTEIMDKKQPPRTKNKYCIFFLVYCIFLLTFAPTN